MTTDRAMLSYTVSHGAEERESFSLVLIHGAGGSRLDWPPELRRLGQARLPGATVYTLDLPGHGRSSGKGRDAIEDYAADVVAFLDAVGIERAVVVGHSMGGAIALTMALDSPERVAGIVLIATGARLRVAPSILERVPTDFEAALDIITRYAWAPEASSQLVDLGRERLREAGPDVLLGDLTACDRFDVMERLGEIAVPTLVVAGSADQLAPVKYARHLAKHIPEARLAIIEGAGHMVMLERPAEVAGVVCEFLGLVKKPSRRGEGLRKHGSSVTG
ncbi:MAG: alpha/beta hydrolase [Anaerolineae bacterium]|nr:alpha/beta hydrolase [Anaerolineae bacterium]